MLGSSPSSMNDDQHMQSSSQKDVHSPSDMQDDEYDDEEDEQDDEDDSEEQSANSEDEAKENEELQKKLDRIKQNLKENNNASQHFNDSSSALINDSYQNRERTMQNLNEVLQRQRDRLDNLYPPQPIVYDPAEGFLDSRNSPQSKQMNTQGSANLEKAYEDLEREIRDIKSKLQRSMGGA